MSTTGGKKSFFDVTLLKRVLTFTRPYKAKFIGSIVLAVVLAAFTPVRPYLIQLTVDGYIARADRTLADRAVEALVWIIALQIGLTIVETLMRFYFSYTTSWLGQSVVKDMRVKVFGKILHLNLRQFDRTPIGTLTTRTDRPSSTGPSSATARHSSPATRT